MHRTLRGTQYGHSRYIKQIIQEDLFTYDFAETEHFYNTKVYGPNGECDASDLALLACNDRYFLLTHVLRRPDARHPWIFDRCREVELDPDGHIDLWARFHYKSTIITFAGVIQEILCDPEIKIAIFSVTQPIARTFLAQIKEEFESNENLKLLFRDTLFDNPRTLNPMGARPAKWSLDRGITIKRKSNPKEATLEAHGLIDGQPTSRHYDLHVYDDVVTQDYLSEESIRKTTERWEMADNLGSHEGVRKWIAGTRYHFADTYGVIIERASALPRIYPATIDGHITGKPVFLSPERWEQIRRDQRSTVAAQMLLNPIAGSEATFQPQWLRGYDVIPSVLNVYIMCDPSKGTGERSDRTAIVVVGIDVGGNKYLLDGVRHRMSLAERWAFIKAMHRKWSKHPGVQITDVGYERYGMQVDLEVLKDMMERERIWIDIKELATPRQGGHSKDDRIQRLEPDIRESRFYLPRLAYHPDHKKDCWWGVWTERDVETAKAKKDEKRMAYRPGQVVYEPWRGPTKIQTQVREYRVVTALRRLDEDKRIYDVTRAFIEELMLHPFGQYKDLIDATSRIYDMEPHAPVHYEARSTESIEMDANESIESEMEQVVDYSSDHADSMGVPFR